MTYGTPICVYTNIRHCSRVMLYSSTQIYDESPDRHGSAVQVARRRDPPANPGTAADRRSLRVRHPREPEDPPAEGVASPRVPAAVGPRRDTARRPVGSL